MSDPQVQPTDFELLQAWRAGDARAGSTLLRRQLPTLRRFFVNKTPVDAEDLIQTTMLECVRSVDRFEQRAQFRTYLLGIAYRVLLHYFRHKARKTSQLDPLTHSIERLSTGLFSKLMQKTEQELVLQALRRIPLKLQTVFELYYWEQMTSRECAIVLEIPEGTVKSLLRRGKELIREAIEQGSGTTEQRRGTVENLDTWIAEIHAEIGDHPKNVLAAKENKPGQKPE